MQKEIINHKKRMRKTYKYIVFCLLLFICSSSYSQNASQFIVKAKKGDPVSQMYLALCFNEGKGVEKNDSLAFYWYHRSAQKGLADAQVMLAKCYRDGVGTEKNDSLAFYWYERASECNFTLALDALGDCYRDGYYVKKDKEKAREYYVRARDRGFKKAIYKIQAIDKGY